MALVAFLGGLSAATAMVIVDSVAVAVMISNHIVMPIVLRRRGGTEGDLGGFVLVVRRVSIVAVILLAYAYYRGSSEAALAAIGLLSFAAIAQIAPAFLGGLIWSRGTALGASAGLSSASSPGPTRCCCRASSGTAWSGPTSSMAGPFGLDGPQADGAVRRRAAGVDPRRGLEPDPQHRRPTSHVSLWRPVTAMERMQANVFVSEPRRACDAELPPVSRERHGGRVAGDGGALSRRGADDAFLRRFRA